MQIYRYLVTSKAKDPQGQRPTHYLKAFENKGDQTGEFVASLWAKEGKDRDGNGTYKFLSGEMKAQYTDHTDSSKSREGFVIVKEADLNRLLRLEREVSGEDAPESPEIDNTDAF